jgi:hypothetical protein
VWAHDNGDELRRGRDAEYRNIKAGVIGLLIERTLHERVGHNTNNRAPRLRLRGIKDSHSAA